MFEQEHHTYFCFGYNSDDVAAQLTKRFDMSWQGNPDVLEKTFEVLGIDDVRALTREAYIKPLGAHKVFIITLDRITIESQQALLKLLEEPPAGVHMAFVLPASTTLLGTLLSRGVVLRNEHSYTTLDIIDKTPGERLAYIEQLLRADDAQHVEDFLNNIEHYAHDALPHTKELAQHIVAVRKALSMRGTSKKQLLESVVLLLD